MKPFAQTHLKEIITLFVIIAILAMFILVPRACQKKEVELAKSIEINKNIDLAKVDIWKDRYDREHYKLEQSRVDRIAMQILMNEQTALLNVKTDQISEYTSTITSLNANLKIQHEIVSDTIEGKPIQYNTFSHKDKWISVNGDIGKFNQIRISGQDTLTKVDYSKKKWLFGRTHYYSDFSNKNPYIQIAGLKQVEMYMKPKRFSIGPYVGVDFGYDQGFTVSPSIGISLQYGIIKF